MLLRLGLMMSFWSSLALPLCCTCFVALALLMTANATTLPGPTLTDAAPAPGSCACPASEFILCNCSILAKFRTKLSGRIKLPDRQMRLWPRRGRLAWQILPRPSRSPIPNARYADQNYLKQAIFVIKRTKPNIIHHPHPPTPIWASATSCILFFQRVSQERRRAHSGASLIVISGSAHKSLDDHRKTASCKSKNNSIYNRWSRGGGKGLRGWVT